jgi:hypothetical protein
MNFVVVFVNVTYKSAVTMQELNFDDSNGTNGFNMLLPASAAGLITYQIVPKLFQGELIKIHIAQNIAANDFISVTFSGFYEDI